MSEQLQDPCRGCTFAATPKRLSRQAEEAGVGAGLLSSFEAEERSLVAQGFSARLRRPPVFSHFCESFSEEPSLYLLCRSVAGSHCSRRVCGERREDCARCTEGVGACIASSGESVDLSLKSRYELTLGRELRLQTEVKFGDWLGGGSHEESLVFSLRNALGRVALRDDDSLNGGYPQTVLVFGGPGSGKTHTLLKMLGQFLEQSPGGNETGALILDPKGVLVGDIQVQMRAAGRPLDQLVIIGPRQGAQGVNLLGLDGLISDRQLGHLLADIIIANFSNVADWDSFLYEYLEAATVLLRKVDGECTLKSLVLGTTKFGAATAADGRATLRPRFVSHAMAALQARTPFSDELRADPDFVEALERIDLLVSTSEARQMRYLGQLIVSSLGPTVERRFSSLSVSGLGEASIDGTSSLWRAPFDNGSVVVVSIGEGDPAVRRTVCTLAKSLFQIAAGVRISEGVPGSPSRDRLVSLFCDEFGAVLTERDADGMSDADFFSRSRQYRCLNLLALQSVHMGLSRVTQVSRWNSIIGNANVRVFMSLNDSETAALGSAIAGRLPTKIPTSSRQETDQGERASQGFALTERSLVPESVLLQGLSRGRGVAIGRLDGWVPEVTFFQTDA